MLYYTLVYPYLTYCNIVWGTAKLSVINKLFILQKRAVRLCTASGYRAASNPLFIQLKILKLHDINNLQTAMFMFKFNQKLLPNSSMHYVSEAAPCRVYETRNKTFFKHNKFRTAIREKSLSIRGPRLWETVPEIIQNCYNPFCFKRKLTAHYISSC